MNAAKISAIKPGTKVLFANFPGDGHFNPLTSLAVHLKEIGCDVRWYTAVKYEQKIRSLGLSFFPFKKAFDVSAHEDIDTVFPERKKHKSQVSKLRFDLINAFILRAPEYFEDVKDIYQEFSFDIMVCDICFGGIPFVTEKMNIPVIAISIVPLIETSKDLPPMGLGLTPSSSFFGKRKQDLLRLFADKVLFAAPNKVIKNILQEHGISHNGENVFDTLIHKSTLVLQSGTPGFEYDRSDIGHNIRFIGPLLPHAKQKTSKPWHSEKLKEYEKVILVTQGTVERDINKLLVPTLEAFKNSEYLVIVTTGGSQTKELQARYGQPNIIIEDFIPFEEVMPHADVYVSNGGYGGVLLGIKHNLPLVVGGMHEGKNEINARIGYFKLGVNMKTEKPSKELVKASVEKALWDNSYRNNIIALHAEFNQYKPTALLEKYVMQLLPAKTRSNNFIREENAELIY